MKSTSFVSIIVPAKNEGENVKTTLDSIFSSETTHLFEVIIVDDDSSDHCCDFIKTYKNKKQLKLIKTKGIGAANARNLGATHSTGQFLIFCDAHLQFEDWWIDQLIEPLKTGKTNVVTPGIADYSNSTEIGYGQTLTKDLKTRWNEKQDGLFETAVIPGGCFAITRQVFNDVGGFETRFRSWGHEDVEFSIKLWLFGYCCHVQPNVKILHLFRKKHPYKVSVYDVNYNLLRMAFLHFNEYRIEKCKRLLRYQDVNRIESHVIKDKVLKQRDHYFKKRIYDDDWYFSKFKINF